MKKFAVVLIIAVLALGCVFAESNHSFKVTTKIGEIQPVYKIVGTNDDNKSAESSADGTNEVVGILSTDGDSISINVALKHFGYKNNTAGNLDDIWYNGSVSVTITAGKLQNAYLAKDGTTKLTDTTGHVAASNDPTTGAFTANTTNTGTAKNVTVTGCAASTTSNVATISVVYNGMKVATGTNELEIASGSFKWDISTLTAGDTYKADVTVTYTVE